MSKRQQLILPNVSTLKKLRFCDRNGVLMLTHAARNGALLHAVVLKYYNSEKLKEIVRTFFSISLRWMSARSRRLAKLQRAIYSLFQHSPYFMHVNDSAILVLLIEADIHYSTKVC